MRFLTSLIAAGAFLITSTTVQAGGLADEIMEPPIVAAEEPPSPGSSINSTFLIIGVLAALLITAAVNADDDDDTDLDGSDIRLKQDITQIGMTANGLPLYSFRYIGEDQLYSGVMAQDVLKHTPQAVVMRRDGYLAVNYGMLGISMEKLD